MCDNLLKEAQTRIHDRRHLLFLYGIKRAKAQLCIKWRANLLFLQLLLRVVRLCAAKLDNAVQYVQEKQAVQQLNYFDLKEYADFFQFDILDISIQEYYRV